MVEWSIIFIGFAEPYMGVMTWNWIPKQVHLLSREFEVLFAFMTLGQIKIL